jgi:hypothetical protein
MELEVHPALQPFAHGAYAHPQDLQQHARRQEVWAGHCLQTARAHKHEGPEWPRVALHCCWRAESQQHIIQLAWQELMKMCARSASKSKLLLL